MNFNGKSLLGIFSVVLVITAITVIPIVFSLAGGKGKAQGNSCMSECMGVAAKEYDLSKEITQHCRYLCNAGVGEGVCTSVLDGCCVLETNDPDCGCTDSPCVTVTVYDGTIPVQNTLVYITVEGEEILGTTDESGVVNWPGNVCLTLNPDDIYSGLVITYNEPFNFMTNCAGGEDVKVYVQQ